MKEMRKRIDLKLVSNEKDFLKWISKPSYTSQKVFDNNLVSIRKNKVTFSLNKQASFGMCFLALSKVLMYKFHYNYIRNKYGNNSRPLSTDIHSLMYETKIEDGYDGFNNDKEIFDLSNYSTRSKYYNYSQKIVKTGGFVIEEFVGLKPKTHLFLLDNSTKRKQAKSMNKLVIAPISHNEYKDFLLNKKRLRHSINRIEGKDHN